MTAPDLSPAEAAIVARFDAAPTPPELLREQLAVALWQSDVDVDVMAAPDSVARLWPKVVEKFPEDAAAYRRLADAALAAFRDQQDPAAARCLDLADRLQRGEVGSPGMGVVAFLIRTAVHDSILTAIGGDGR